MGFTENYLERRKKRTGQSLTVAPLEKEAAPAASSGSRAGNDFTARYLARRESRTVLPEVPALSLPSLPGSAASSTVERKAETKKPTVDFRGIPLAYSPDRAVSGANIQTEKQTGKASGFGKGGTRTTYQQGFQGQRTPGGPDWRELAKQTALAGVGQVSKAASSTLSAAEQLVTRPLGYVMGNPELYRDAVFYRNNQDVDQVNARIQENLGRAAEKAGTAGRLVAEFGPPTVAALPQAGLAWLTAGKSLAAQTSTAGLQAASTAAQGGGVASTIMNGFRQLAANPSFQYSFLNTVGGDFEQALSDGADVPTAYAYAALTSLANGMIEVGGGIDTLPEKDKPALMEWVKSMFDEGKEEVVQGAISQAMQNAAYGKKNPVFSTTDEDAIINPGRMAKDFAGGAVVGGVLGGGQIAVNSALNNSMQNAQLRRDADLYLWNRQQAVQRGQEGQAAPQGTQIPGAQLDVQNGQKNSAPTAIQTGVTTESGITGTAGTHENIVQQAEITVNAGDTLISKMRQAIPQMQDMRPVAEISGKEIPQSGRITDRLAQFVNSIGNKVNRPGFGDVLFSKGKLKSSMVGHGIGDAKIEIFAAVPEVIRSGKQIDFQKNWKGRNYDTYVFAAPVSYRGIGTYLGVIVQKDSVSSRYYLHEVVDATGNVIYSGKEVPASTSDGTSALAGDLDTVVDAGTADLSVGTPLDGEGQGAKPLSPGVSSGAVDISESIVPSASANVKPVNSVENAENGSRSAVLMTGRLVRMGERGETAARLGGLLGRVADGQTLKDSEWNELRGNANAAPLIDIAAMFAERNAGNPEQTAQNPERTGQNIGGQQNAAGQEPNLPLPDGRENRGAGQDSGGPAETVPAVAELGTPAGERGGQTADAGTAQGAVADRRSGRQSLKAIQRQNAVTESGARMVSTREYMGLDLGSDRPCLFDAPEEVIRGDRVLSEVYDEIWEMGYRPHMFTGTPEMEDSGFGFNGAVRGEDVFIRIDHSRYDADAIWDHEKFHILSAEDPGLRSSVRDAVMEKYGEEELLERIGVYLEKYRGAYGMENAQGVTELSEADMDLILEELLADAYAGKDTFSAGVQQYRDTTREIAAQRENEGRMTRGPPSETRYAIRDTGDGRNYVQADRPVITGQDPDVWAEQVENYINSKIRHGEDVELLTEDGDTLLLTRETAGKAKHAFRPDGSRMTDGEYETKLNAEAHIDELARTSTRDRIKPDVDKKHGDFASKGWQYRRAYFRDFDGKYYICDISVAQNEQGNVVYNIGSMKERSFPTVAGSSAKGGAQKDGKASLEATVPHPTPDVKPLRLPEVESTVEKTGESVDNTKFSADEDQEKITPAGQRKAASKKLADDLAEVFPETQKSYLRNLADEIRAGATQEQLEALFTEAYDSAKVFDDSPETVELKEIAHELRGRRVYVDQSVREEFGDDWKATRQFFFGKGLYFTNDSSDTGLDVLNGEMASKFGGRFQENETDMSAVISRMEYYLRGAASRQITLDEQARQYGGEEAAEQFREAYRQRFMDAAESYRDAMSGIDKAQQAAREQERQRRRRQLDDYVAQARQTLRDRAARGMDTGKTAPRTLVPEGVSVEDYVQSLDQRAAQAKADRLRTVLREDFRGSEAMEKLGIRITGTVTDRYQDAKALRERQTAAEQAKKALRLAEKRLNATEAEKQFAAGITSGVYTERDIPQTMNANKVMELADYYMGERAFGLDMLRQQKADISRVQQEKAKEIFGPALEASEGKKKLIGGVMGKLGDAFALNNRTAERNMRSIFGDENGEKINQWLFAPVAENEGERYRFVNRMMDRVRAIEGGDGKAKRLTKEESALVQKVIEGRAAEETVASMEMSEAIQNAAAKLNEGGEMQDVAREFKLDKNNRRLARQYAQWLTTQEELASGKADTARVENAVKIYSELYGQFYEAINDFLTVHGYEPIGFIKGYAPHMQSKEATGALKRAFQALGVSADVSGLPTEIAGQTKDFKPGKKWNPFFQTRRGEATSYDIEAGFERYVENLSDVLYHTDDIARIREANKFLRRMYAQEEISENLSRAEELKYKTVQEKRAFLIDQGELDGNSALSAADIDRKMSDYADRLYDSVKNTTQYGQLAVYLDDYANSLAGKQVFADRDMERSFGRTSLNVGNKLTRAFTRAQVAGNLSSVLNQTSQLPIIQAEVGGKYLRHAMADILTGKTRRGDWVQKSDFLMEKNGIHYITTSAEDMIVDTLFKPLGFVDGYLSTLAVRGRYLREIDAGKSEAEAMRIADRFGREVMGSRAKGSAPMAFQSKNIFNRMLHTFQLEALNTWEHLSQDLPRDFREIEKSRGKSAAARALAGVAVKILVGNFLLNRTAEMLYGGTPAQGDILGIIGNFIASGAGTTLNATAISALKTLLNAGWEKLMGEPLFDDEEDDDEKQPFDWGEAAAEAGSDILNDIPLAQNMGALLGVGDLSLPMPDIAGGISRTKQAIEEDGPFSWEVARQLMGLAGDVLPGGRQAEKTFQGLDTALRGGRFSGYGEDEKLMYPVDDNPFTALRAALFGNAALEETGEYYASGEKALSASQTRLYKSLVSGGADKKEIYHAILDWRRVKADAELTSEEKARLGEEIVGNTELSDPQKLTFYRGLTGADSRADKLEVLMDSGMSWEEAIRAYAQYDEIGREELTASQKATEFARWADENYSAKQARAVKEQFVYYSMVPAQAGRYEKLTGAGLGTDTAYQVSELLSKLEPEPGKNQVSNMQKYQAIVSAGLSEQDQLAALESVMSGGEFDKVKAGYQQGVTPALYVAAREEIAASSGGNTSQEEAKQAIKNMDGLTKEQKAALWQVQNKSWNADNNPFSRKVGREVYDALHQTPEGLSLPTP